MVESVGFRELLKKRDILELPVGELLKFNGVEGLTVYNPAPITSEGVNYLWARAESPELETDSEIRLFRENENGEFSLVSEAPVFKDSKDPFDCGVVDGYHVFGGVQIYDVPGTSDIGYRTVMYKYRNLIFELLRPDRETVEPFLKGPEKMKGVRIIEIAPGRIGVFTRPQGKFGGRGAIGYFEVENLDELESELTMHDEEMSHDSLIDGLFVTEGEAEWGGANALYLLSDGRIGVLGHIAGFGDNFFTRADGTLQAKKEYHAITFIFDPNTREVENVQIVATADQFPEVAAKNESLGSILYSGGLTNHTEDGYKWLHVGVGDSKSGKILIKYPFTAK